MTTFTTTITGNVVADAELRVTPSGKSVTNFRIAANSREKQGEEWVDGAPTWVTVTAWGAIAEAVAEVLKKGTAVLVTGRMRTREWESDSGETRSSLEMTADDVGLLVKPAKRDSDASPPVSDIDF